MKLLIKRHDQNAKIPTKAYTGEHQLGIDFYALEEHIINPRSVAKIPTGISIQLSDPGYGIIFKDKSGISTKKHLSTIAGVIDADYTGQIFITVYNRSNDIVYVGKHEPLTQGVVTKIYNVEIEEVDRLDEDRGSRGDAGWGSSSDKHRFSQYK